MKYTNHLHLGFFTLQCILEAFAYQHIYFNGYIAKEFCYKKTQIWTFLEVQWIRMRQCQGHGFSPWSGMIPHATEQLSPGAAVTGTCTLQCLRSATRRATTVRRSPRTTLKSRPRLLWLEKALALQWGASRVESKSVDILKIKEDNVQIKAGHYSAGSEDGQRGRATRNAIPEARKGKRTDSHLEPLWCAWSGHTLILALYDSFHSSGLQNCQGIHFCGHKPHRLWRFGTASRGN